MDNVIKRMLQVGIVTDVDPLTKCVRVKFKDSGMTSGWLYVLQRNKSGIHIEPEGEHTHEIRDTWSGGGEAEVVSDHEHEGSYGTYWMPAINDKVLVAYLPILDADGFVLGGVV